MPTREPESILSHAGRRLLDRRSFLTHAAGGLSGMALASLLAGDGRLLGNELSPIRPDVRLDAPLAARAAHFAPRAKRVLMIFCSGACSHVDSWDYKPELIKRHDTPMPGAEELVTFQGENGNLIKSPWKFRPRGESGKYISDLLPNLAELADEMCFIHSMTSKTNTHGPGENFMSTGFTVEGYPSAGAWVYVCPGQRMRRPAGLCGDSRSARRAAGGAEQLVQRLSAGRVPGHVIQRQQTDRQPGHARGNQPGGAGLDARFSQSAQRSAPRAQPRRLRVGRPHRQLRVGRQAATERPEVGDLVRETAATHAAYGTDDANEFKAGFARNCLLARRLLERGVRFVQLFNGAYAMGEGVGNWDGHKKLKDQYSVHAPILDQPAAALLEDLKARGMLDDTLVVWTTEFGRMPTFQVGANGRDHNPKGFTVWLAGAGVKRATSYGATDEFGYQAVENPSSVYELYATLLHLLGLDHQRLSYFHNGTEQRLTFVHGRVIEDVLA